MKKAIALALVTALIYSYALATTPLSVVMAPATMPETCHTRKGQ